MHPTHRRGQPLAHQRRRVEVSRCGVVRIVRQANKPRRFLDEQPTTRRRCRGCVRTCPFWASTTTSPSPGIMTGPILRPPPSAAVAAARAAAGRGGRGLKRSRPASWMASISQGSNPRGYCCCLLALASTAAAAAGAAAAGGGRGTTTTLLRRAVYIAAFQPAHPLPTTSAPRRRLLASSATAGGGGGMMDDPFSLRTPVPVDPLPTAVRIKHADQLVLMGSCFSDNIGCVCGGLEGEALPSLSHHTTPHHPTPTNQKHNQVPPPGAQVHRGHQPLRHLV